MGNQPTKSTLGQAITYLNICAEPIKYRNDKFWDKIWTHEDTNGSDINITIQEIRMLRDGSSKNFATLTCKMVERVYLSTRTLCNTHGQQVALLNATRILTKLIPCIFEDPDWRSFFLENQMSYLASEEPELRFPQKCDKQKNFRSYLPTEPGRMDPIEDEECESDNDNLDLIGCEDACCPSKIDFFNNNQSKPSFKSTIDKSKLVPDSLLKTLVIACCDLLFCPEFSVPAHNDSYLSRVADIPPEDLQSLASCDYVWEPGVGFESYINSTTTYDNNRIQILRLLLACFSETLYLKPNICIRERNYWIETFTTSINRHALPLFTSLLNTIFGYKPSRLVPLNSMLYNDDSRQNLVELASQILIISLDYELVETSRKEKDLEQGSEPSMENLFAEYMSRIHRDEDFIFIIGGFTRLLNNQLEKGYLLSSIQNINLEQELFVLFWRICNLNKNFMDFLLKSQEILDIIVPILYYMNINFQNQAKTALIHLGVFNLLVLSGERNFAVRLNKQHSSTILPNLPYFTGTHADLMIIVFHKLILYGYNIYQLFDYMTTIIVNISPYIKALSMVASKCLIQLFEIFSSPEVIFTEPAYHQMVVNLLETFNNMIQYQFDGNANLICAIMTRKYAFINLRNLPSSESGIQRVLNRLIQARDGLPGEDENRLMLNMKDKNDDDTDTKCNNIDEERISSKIADADLMKCKKDQSIGSSDSNRKDAQPYSSSSNNTTNESASNATLSTTNASTMATMNDYSYTPDRAPGNSQLTGGINSKQRIVSLVATPNISNVVHTINPLDSSGDPNRPTKSLVCPKSGPDNAKVTNHDLLTLTDEDKPDEIFGLNDTDMQADTSSNELRRKNAIEITKESAIESPTSSTSSSMLISDKLSTSPKETSTEEGGKRTTEPAGASAFSKWIPNSEYIKRWKRSLPLHTTLRTIEVLSPQIEKFKDQTNSSKAACDIEIIKFVQNGTLVGLLPVPHPILMRRYRTNEETSLWFRVCTWGIIFVKQSVWSGTSIKLIKPYQHVLDPAND